MNKPISTHHGPTADVPYSVYGDMAGEGDTRHPLHHKPLVKRGPTGQVTYTTPIEKVIPDLHYYNNDNQEGD